MTNAVELFETPSGLLIFDYTPNLTIVGTTHAVSPDIKRDLDEIISESDFVAVEYDDLRRRKRGVAQYTLWFHTSGYNPETHRLYVNLLDAVFLELLCAANGIRIRIENHRLMLDQGELEFQSEFLYCIEKAEAMGKNAYMVDMPIFETLGMLVQMPMKTKFETVLTHARGKPLPEAAGTIIETRREQYMLDRIEECEGPLSELQRKGVLIVGLSHAENYAKRMKSCGQEKITPQSTAQHLPT